MTRPTVSTRHAIVGIMLALALWGGYLAVGATGMFLDDALFDARKSAIVIACVGVFLGFWVVVPVAGLFADQRGFEWLLWSFLGQFTFHMNLNVWPAVVRCGVCGGAFGVADLIRRVGVMRPIHRHVPHLSSISKCYTSKHINMSQCNYFDNFRTLACSRPRIRP